MGPMQAIKIGAVCFLRTPIKATAPPAMTDILGYSIAMGGRNQGAEPP